MPFNFNMQQNILKMDEILSTVQQRMIKIEEVRIRIQQSQHICSQLQKTHQYHLESSDIYDAIRKYKEEEKNRKEKETWIIQIMRNIRALSQDQMRYLKKKIINLISHVFMKTNEIMKKIETGFLIYDYPIFQCLQDFLDQYYNLHVIFFKYINFENQIKSQFKLAIKQGNILLITDLIKLLLDSSRSIFNKTIKDYSSTKVLEKSNQSQKNLLEMLQLQSKPKSLEKCSSSQKHSIIHRSRTAMQARNDDLMNATKSEKYFMKQPNIIRKTPEKRNRRSTIECISDNQISMLDTTIEKQVPVQSVKIQDDKKSLYLQMILQVIEDIDETSLLQLYARKSQEAIYDRTKNRNYWINNTISQYRIRVVTQTEHIKLRFLRLNGTQMSVEQQNFSNQSSPSKYMIRKSSKSIKRPQFPSNLINQIRQRSIFQSIGEKSYETDEVKSQSQQQQQQQEQQKSILLIKRIEYNTNENKLPNRARSAKIREYIQFFYYCIDSYNPLRRLYNCNQSTNIIT